MQVYYKTSIKHFHKSKRLTIRKLHLVRGQLFYALNCFTKWFIQKLTSKPKDNINNPLYLQRKIRSKAQVFAMIFIVNTFLIAILGLAFVLKPSLQELGEWKLTRFDKMSISRGSVTMIESTNDRKYECLSFY